MFNYEDAAEVAAAYDIPLDEAARRVSDSQADLRVIMQKIEAKTWADGVDDETSAKIKAQLDLAAEDYKLAGPLFRLEAPETITEHLESLGVYL